MRKTLQRILALIGVLFLLSLIGMTLFFAITGSPYFLASMVSMILIPIFIYGYMIVYRALSKDKMDSQESEDTKDK